MNHQLLQKSAIVLLFLMIVSQTIDSVACTRVMYQGPNGTVITARSMDWSDDIASNLWIFPRGMARSGEAGPNSLKWKSKYGSVITSGYDICSTDGMNEKGLVANLLWLAESQYEKYDGKKPGLAISAWVQYVLDNFQTVNEAVNELAKQHFTVVTANVPGTDRMANLHLAISDPSGDNAIFEYVNGKLDIHHNKAYQVMTNSPIFEKQLALNEYWKEIGGTTMLPGTNRAADRFVRASFYVHAIPQTDNIHIATASMFSVIRNCSVPYGITTPGQPNISSTRWRTVSDQKNLVYYFENVLSPNTFWVDLKKVDFAATASVKRLAVSKGEIYAGETSKDFKVTKAFQFAGL
ncbi:linear amide C-N hydrolase [Mucilaginibacter jinjuensis]|uniref:Linear amide C-N hydrolase n=1 Tax=Mucilaginibacter jinjuensis TaxID=1176721 RepID=A0ABY7TBY9_9SPHI|nr:linear amide C-N hydrolase [Mucilaginibacter jinjuensis]WCT13223.1 linear amide C-N hydrolase [Mucilaginibacter jinjuensis]